MLTKSAERALYLAVVLFMVVSLLVGVALWGAVPASVQAQIPPTLATPTPVPVPPAPAPTPVPPLPPTVAIVFPASPDGEMGIKAGYDFAVKNGLRVVAEMKYPPGDVAFVKKLMVEVAQGIKPGFVYIGGASDSEASLIQQLLKELGYGGKVVVGPIGPSFRPPQTTHVNMGWQEGKGPAYGLKDPPLIPAVVEISPRSFAMWYQAGGAGINWATSGDGVAWSDRGPITVTGGMPDGYQLMRPSVVFWRETVGVVAQEHFLMYATAYANIGGVRHYDYIVVLQSTDGATWSYVSTPFTEANPGVDPPGDQYGMTVVKTDAGYQGWLAQGDAVLYTTSSDGAAWNATQPTTGLPGSVVRPAVVRLAGKYLAWYSQTLDTGAPPLTAIGMALSDDGIAWTPNPENPLFKVEPNSWRSELAFAPWVVLDEYNGLWRMWFTGRTSHVQANTEFLTLDPASPTDTPSPGRFAQGVGDPNSIVMQLRFPSASNPVEAVTSAKDDEGNSYGPFSLEPGGKVIIGGWGTLNGGSKPATNETLAVRYNQRVRDYSLGYAQAPTHILGDAVQKASWGDEIIVHPGVYLGQVYGDKALKLRSSHGPALTMVDARREQKYATPKGSYPAIWLNAAEGSWGGLPDSWWRKFGVPETRIEGFTALNSLGNGIALHLLPGDKAKLNPGGRVMSNVVRGIEGRGIVVVSSSGNMRLENNQVYGNSAGGIHVIASAWVGLFNNNIHDNPVPPYPASPSNREGILLESLPGGWAFAHVQDNTVSNNGGPGVLSAMNDAYFQHNAIGGNAGDGIHVEPGSATVLDNTIQNNAGHGVSLVGKGGRQVAHNTIAGNGGNGIYVATSGNLISANQVTGNQQGGMWVEGDGNRILGNTIQGNLGGSSGIHLTASAEGNQVHYNNISGNSSHGVFKEGTPPTDAPVDAINNWWGQASGPSGAGPGTGDAVNDNVLFTPWLTAPFPGDTTPPVIAETLALPSTVSLFGMFKNDAGTTLGPAGTSFTARASDEHSGAVGAEVNLRPLTEMLTSDLQVPPEREAEWQDWLQKLEHQRMGYNGAEWEGKFSLPWLVNEIAMRFGWWGMGDMTPVLPLKLRPGEAQVPVTVYDGAGNQASANIALSVVNAMVPLNEGWNLRSLPIALDDDTWGGIKALGDGLAADAALRFNDSTQQWQVLSDADRWRPLDGIYIHATEPDHLDLNVGRSPTAPPVRDLAAGWALVGPASTGPDMAVTDALRSLEVNATGQRGYIIATSPPQLADYRQVYRHTLPDGAWRDYGSYDWHFEQRPWVYLSGDAWQGQTMTAAGGYWVYMEHPDTLVGFSSTPVISGIQPEAAALTPKPAQAGGPPPLPMVLRITAGAGWSKIAAKVGAQVVGQISNPGDTLLVQGDLAKNMRVNFYVDGVIADQKIAYESGKVASVSLTLGGRADTNADHVVDVFDLAEVAARFNSRVTPGDPADVNGDGVVNILDLTKVGMRFGRSSQ